MNAKPESIFELKQQFTELKNEMSTLNKSIQMAVDYHTHMLDLQWKDIMHRLMLLIAVQDDEAMKGYEDWINDPKTDREIDYVLLKRFQTKSYSKFNFVYLSRRFWNEYKLASNKIKDLHSRIKASLSNLKVLKGKLVSLNLKITSPFLDEIELWRKTMVSLLEYKIPYFRLVPFLEFLFIGGNTISKQELLNLSVLDKSAATKKYINGLPNQINYDTFVYSFFVHSIEDDNYNWIADVYLEDFIYLKENKDFEVKMSKELIGNIPTYQVTFDEFNEVSGVEKNPPVLKLV